MRSRNFFSSQNWWAKKCLFRNLSTSSERASTIVGVQVKWRCWAAPQSNCRLLPYEHFRWKLCRYSLGINYCVGQVMINRLRRNWCATGRRSTAAKTDEKRTIKRTAGQTEWQSFTVVQVCSKLRHATVNYQKLKTICKFIKIWTRHIRKKGRYDGSIEGREENGKMGLRMGWIDETAMKALRGTEQTKY